MHTRKGRIVELILENGRPKARINCPKELIPSAGQYLLAGTDSLPSDPLPVPLFSTDSTPQGFITDVPTSKIWTPGTEITLHGPFGHGFLLPAAARKVVLATFGDFHGRVHGLIGPALAQGAAVVLLTDGGVENLPDEVEVQPLSALENLLTWADYIAFDIVRESLPNLKERLKGMDQPATRVEAQVLVLGPMPCGGIADCGVCAVKLGSAWRLACKEGPVFGLEEL